MKHNKAWFRATAHELKTWAKDFWTDAHEFDEYAYFCRMGFPQQSPSRLRFAMHLFAQYGRRLVCVLSDHVLVDDGSYANGDSGGEGYRCSRCGWSWWHQYY